MPKTQAQADFLTLCGCDMAQGYYFDKPLWEADLIKRIDAMQMAKDARIDRFSSRLAG